MSNELINVHVFDGQLKNIFKPNREYSTDEKNKLFYNLILKLKDARAISSLNLIITDMVKPSGENYQIENNLNSSDILADILSKDYEDILPLLEEQCPITQICH